MLPARPTIDKSGALSFRRGCLRTVAAVCDRRWLSRNSCGGHRPPLQVRSAMRGAEEPTLNCHGEQLFQIWFREILPANQAVLPLIERERGDV